MGGGLPQVFVLVLGLIVCSRSGAQVAEPGTKALFQTLNPNVLEFDDYYLCKRLFTTSGARGMYPSRVKSILVYIMNMLVVNVYMRLWSSDRLFLAMLDILN